MKKLILLAGVLCAPTFASATPVYLQCLLRGGVDGSLQPWDITLHEAEEKVDYSHSLNSDSVPGEFTKNEIKFFILVINRHDLTVTRTINYSYGPQIDKGQCKVLKRKR